MKLVAIGDNVVDYYKDREEIYPGGNALNVAVLSRRYGADYSSYIGITGNDRASAHVLAALQQEGIDITRIRQAIGPNGMATVTLNQDGDRIFVGSNKGGVQAVLGIRLHPDDLLFIHSHDLLHTSVYSNFERELPRLHKDIAISFDFSTRRDRNYLEEVCPNLTYAFFSGSDFSHSECLDFIRFVHESGTPIVGVTRGKDGAIFSERGVIYEQQAVDAPIVDTLGAGDSFIAMFLTQYHQYHRMEEALQKAAEAAAKTCAYYGAFGYGVKNPFTE